MPHNHIYFVIDKIYFGKKYFISQVGNNLYNAYIMLLSYHSFVATLVWEGVKGFRRGCAMYISLQTKS